MRHQDKVNPVVKKAASFARKVAQNNVSAACGTFIHQPKEPADMSARLRTMRARDNKA